MAATEQASYETVLEMGELVWIGIGYGLHGLALGVELLLALFLLVTGILAVVQPEPGERQEQLWWRLGATRIGTPDARGCGFLRIVLGAQLLAPVLVRAPWQVALLGSLAALVLLVLLERGVPAEWRRRGRLLRFASIAAAATRRSSRPGCPSSSIRSTTA